MPEVTLKVSKGKATIEQGGDTFIGKLLASHKGKIKVNTPYGQTEIEIKAKKK